MNSRDTDGETPDAFDRRRFIKRAAIGTAVATPVVTSFSMSGVSSVFAAQTNVSGQVSPASTEVPTTTTTAGNQTQPTSTTTTTVSNQTQPTSTTTTTVSNQTQTQT